MWCSSLLAITILLNLVYASKSAEPTGEWPTEIYRSTSVFGTSVYFARGTQNCHDGLYTLLAPRGEGVAAHGPTILDQSGNLVWASKDVYDTVYNLDVQEYKGDDYLTFWTGYDKASGHGEGTIRMVYDFYPSLDSSKY